MSESTFRKPKITENPNLSFPIVIVAEGYLVWRLLAHGALGVESLVGLALAALVAPAVWYIKRDLRNAPDWYARRILRHGMAIIDERSPYITVLYLVIFGLSLTLVAFGSTSQKLLFGVAFGIEALWLYPAYRIVWERACELYRQEMQHYSHQP